MIGWTAAARTGHKLADGRMVASPLREAEAGRNPRSFRRATITRDQRIFRAAVPGSQGLSGRTRVPGGMALFVPNAARDA